MYEGIAYKVLLVYEYVCMSVKKDHSLHHICRKSLTLPQKIKVLLFLTIQVTLMISINN